MIISCLLSTKWSFDEYTSKLMCNNPKGAAKSVSDKLPTGSVPADTHWVKLALITFIG